MTALAEFFSVLNKNPRHLSGSFYPHSYAIGLPGGRSAIKMKDYPLPSPATEADLVGLAETICFVHEFVHFTQFVCSSFGFEIARVTNIVQNILLRTGPRRAPILIDADSKLTGEQLDRLVVYLYHAESLVAHSYAVSHEVAERFPRGCLITKPTSPAVSRLPEYPGPEEAVEITTACGQRVINEPHYLSVRPGRAPTETVINTAALMEGFAHLAEIHHIMNALGIHRLGPEVMEKFVVEYPAIYTAPMEIYLSTGYDDSSQLLLGELAALIDLSLMYSPNIIHNVGPTHSVSHGGDLYRMPCEVFIDACLAARSVESMQSFDPTEMQRFQDDVSAKLGIPTTIQMTGLCIDKFESIGIPGGAALREMLASKQPIDAGRMFAAHRLGLEERRRHGNGFFFRQLNSDGIVDIMSLPTEICTYFNLDDKQPVNLHPHRISHACMHHLMRDSFYKKRLDCPLKFGMPFYCPNSESDGDTLCVFVDPNNPSRDRAIGECPLDIFERAALVRA